ncbi:hypothetical protein EDD18DRAFT_1111160 [Armillaria luteobubalina]|uniref:Uncharacterized protein n=2 Tax=Armillaria luteobubalina TaxID=153913 RepID=A0AA39PM41_9AGAR|nr:hypothetical protein EDD18DRAFT_1111160 [Armillaria luteobubalina]
MFSPETVDSSSIPVKAWLDIQKKKPPVIHWNGTLSLDDQARIYNYIHQRITNLKDQGRNGLASLPVAHARTLLVAYRHRDTFLSHEECPVANDGDKNVEIFVLQSAWERLVNYTGLTTDGYPKIASVDVDMEALRMLEDRMFDTSEDAGIAGNCQWGLDVGMHQDNWCPWKFGGENGKGVREGTESELEPGPDFDEDERQEWFRARKEEDNVKKRAHGPVPKPRMISRKRKEILEPETAENSLQDGSAKVIRHPAKRARNKKT